MADWASWKYGAVTFPLTSSTVNPLLLDADPAVYYTLDYFASVIQTYLEPRLMAEVSKAPAITQIQKAIQSVAPFDPAPYLTEAQITFPLLSIARQKGKFEDKTMTWLHRISEWKVQYVFPPMNMGQAERVLPFFNGVAMVLHNRIEELQDVSYRSNALVWQLAGIESILLGEETYGRYEAADNLVFPTWSVKLEVKERLGTTPAELSVFGGIDTAVDLAGADAPTLLDVVDTAITYVDPTTIPGIVSIWRPDFAVLASDKLHVASIPDVIVASGNTQAQATSAKQPILFSGALKDFNGVQKPVLRFDGLTSSLAATVPQLANDSSRTIVCLARLSSTTQRSSLVAQTLLGDTGAHSLAIEANTASSAGSLFGVFADASSYDAPQITDTGWHVFSLIITATTNGSSVTTSTTLQIDGSTAQALTLKSGAGTWQGMATANQIALGAIPGIAGTNAAADLGPVLVFNSALTAAQLATAITYCKQWGGLS